MQTAFKIVSDISDNAVNLGRIESPRATPSNTVIYYDYSGHHLANVSSFPDRKRLVPVQYDAVSQVWKLEEIYAGDVKLTNRLLTKRGINKTVPLYFKHTTREPMQSATAYWDNSLQEIVNLKFLSLEYDILDRLGSSINKKEYLHDVDFVPYHIFKDKAFQAQYANLFYMVIYTNGSLGNEVRKIKFSAIVTSQPDVPSVPNYYEFISPEPIFSLFNMSFQFKSGFGSDLLGQSYEGSLDNPLQYSTSNNPMPAHIDPDQNRGRQEGQYSLIYHYLSNSYIGGITARRDNMIKINSKPCSMLSVYFNGVEELSSVGNMYITITNTNEIVLSLKAPGNAQKVFNFFIKGKSTKVVAAEINNSRAPFTAFTVMNIDDIKASDLWIESTDRFTDTLAAHIPSIGNQIYDKTSDGGLILRTSSYFSRYTQSPTVHAAPPPRDRSSLQPWYPRVKFGGFVDTAGRAYFINEYANQAWSVSFGYPWVDNTEEAFFKDLDTIQLNKMPVYPKLEHISLYDSDGNSLNYLIDGIDAARGLVFLKEKFKKRSRKVFIQYSYKENYFEYTKLDLNPVSDTGVDINKLYAITVKPYLTETNEINESTIQVEEISEIPSQTHINNNLILAVFSSVNQFSLEKDYKVIPPTVTGGGLRQDIPSDILIKKVPDLQSFFDKGFLDGIRYPANSVINFTLPSFVKKGVTSILLEDYDPAQLRPNEIKIYGAAKIKTGTKLRIYSGDISLGIFEETIVHAVRDFQTVILQTILVEDYNVGSPIVFDSVRETFFTDEDISNILRKFAATGTYHFIEYR